MQVTPVRDSNFWYTFDMKKLPKLSKGDKVAIVSPSFAASAAWPHVHELGLKRLREVFEFEPVMYPATARNRVRYLYDTIITCPEQSE